MKKLFLFIAAALVSTSMWAVDLCSANFNGKTASANTDGVAETGCTMKWSGVESSSNDITISGNTYRKFGSSGYVQLVLSSGNFQAGDVLTVKLTSNDTNKKVSYILHDKSSGNGPTEITVSKTAAEDLTYTLTAEDIESDGSIKIFRGGSNTSNARYGSFSVTRTSASTDPVSSVAVSGNTAGYATVPVKLTATPDELATAYKWFVDGVEQEGETSAIFNFSAATPGTYSIVAKARNDYNAENVWIASSSHSFTASKLCGELIKIVQSGQKDGNVSGIITGTKDVNLSSGTSEYDSKTGRKIGSDNYYLGVTNLSNPLRAGDVVSVFVTTTSANLILYSDKGVTKIGEKIGGVTQGANEIELTAAATGKTAIYLYRVPAETDAQGGGNMNPFVYSLSVNRSCTESDDCSIKSLTINSESVTPSGKVYSYEVAASSALTEVEVAYTIHPLATASPASGFTIEVPDAGDPANTQTITVTAEDGTHSDTYTISVTKATAASDVVTLDALAVTGYTLAPAFDAAKLAYTITKAYGAEDPAVDKVTYTKSEEAQDVEVTYDGTNHKFVITVTAEDNTTTQDYEITINEAEAPKNLSRVVFSNGFDAFIDNTNHTVKAYYLAGTSAPTASTITAGAGTAGDYADGKITVTGEDDSTVDYIVTLEAVTPNTTTVAASAAAGTFAGDEAWVKNGLLVYGNTAGYDSTNKRYTNRRLKRDKDPDEDQRVIAGWVRSYFFVGNASKFILTISGNNALKYSIDGGDKVANESGTLEIALAKGNHMIEIVSNQTSGDCYMSAPKLVERYTVTYAKGDEGADGTMTDPNSPYAAGDEVTLLANAFTAPIGQEFDAWVVTETVSGDPVAVSDGKFTMPAVAVTVTATWKAINYTVTMAQAGGAGATISGDQSNKHYEDEITVTAEAVTGYNFVGWSASPSVTFADATALETSFSMPNSDVTVTATFSAINYAVTLAAGTNATTAGVANIDYAAAALVITTAPSGTGTLQGFYTEGGAKVADKEGKLVAGDVDGYVTEGKWSRASATTLYAVYDGVPTALDNTADEIKAVKFFENGQLFIRRGEKVYTITGELVK